MDSTFFLGVAFLQQYGFCRMYRFGKIVYIDLKVYVFYDLVIVVASIYFYG